MDELRDKVLSDILEMPAKDKEIWTLCTIFALNEKMNLIQNKINNGFWISNKIAMAVIGAIAAMLGVNFVPF